MSPEAQRRLRQRAAEHGRLRVLSFVAEPDLLLKRASRVVAMGGYNTVTAVLSFRKRALIVPRDGARREQWIRAERLRDLGLLEVLHPRDLSPEAVSRWLATGPALAPTRRKPIDLNGLARLPQLLEELLAAPDLNQRSDIHEADLDAEEEEAPQVAC